jgi:hypothetical protein
VCLTNAEGDRGGRRVTGFRIFYPRMLQAPVQPPGTRAFSRVHHNWRWSFPAARHLNRARFYGRKLELHYVTRNGRADTPLG